MMHFEFLEIQRLISVQHPKIFIKPVLIDP